MTFRKLKLNYMNLCTLQWKESLTSFTKLRTYTKHKVEYKKESYLTWNVSKSKRSLLAQLRLGMLPLVIESGRYTGKSIELRVCIVCDSNVIQNELHFICQFLRYGGKELYDFIDVTIQDINFYTLKVIYHPLYNMNNFVTNQSKLPQSWGTSVSLYGVSGFHVTLWEGSHDSQSPHIYMYFMY